VYFFSRKTGGKIDPKIYVFGESEQSDDTTHFLGHVRAIARTTQAAVIAMAEVWQAWGTISQWNFCLSLWYNKAHIIIIIC